MTNKVWVLVSYDRISRRSLVIESFNIEGVFLNLNKEILKEHVKSESLAQDLISNHIGVSDRRQFEIAEYELLQ